MTITWGNWTVQVSRNKKGQEITRENYKKGVFI